MTKMVAQTALDVRPVTTPHSDIDHLALADRDFQIKHTTTPRHLLGIHCWAKHRFLNHAHDINLWESNLPKYTFPEVHPFPDILHFCQVYYVPSHRAIEAPNHEILFTIIVESTNLSDVHPRMHEIMVIILLPVLEKIVAT